MIRRNRGSSLNEAGALRMSALRRAVAEGYTVMEATGDVQDCSLVTVSDRHRADRCLASDSGRSPLHVCAAYGRSDALASQLSLAAAEINAADHDGRTALHLASRGGHGQCVDKLIQAGADATAVDSTGCTALHLAIKYRQIDIAQVLTKYCPSSLLLVDGRRRTPLHDAVLTGSVELCQIMVQSGADLHTKDAFDRTPLMLACSVGLLSVVSFILTECNRVASHPAHFVRPTAATTGTACNPHHVASLEDSEGAIALHYAVLANRLPLVELVAAQTPDINKAKRCGSTALHIAAVKGYRDVLEVLLSQGAEVDAVDKTGATPLHRASSGDRLACVDLLLLKGASTSICDNECKTASHYAAAAGHSDVLALLLKKATGRSHHQLTCDANLQTPLHHACQSGHLQCAEVLLSWASGQGQETLDVLLKAGDSMGRSAMHVAASQPQSVALLALLLQHSAAGALLTDIEMKTPLHFAAEHNCPNNIALLVTQQADIGAIDLDGRTALHLACASGCEAATALLLAKGSDISQRDWNGRQPLMLAAEARHIGVVRLLLDSDCDVNATDGRSLTALHAACIADSADIVGLLIDRGGDLSARDSAGETPLQIAIAGRCKDATHAVVLHEKWEVAMAALDSEGFTPMRSLIENLPSAAKIVLDRCIKENDDVNIMDSDRKVVYSYKYIDPHPDDPCCRQKKHWFLQLMAQLRETELLFHPLSQSNITYKWSRFGALFHWLRFATFVVYLSLLTAYTFAAPGVAAATNFDFNGCPISNATNETQKHYFQQFGQDLTAFRVKPGDDIVIFLQTLLLTMSILSLVQEITSAVIMRCSYLLKASSYVTLLLIGTTIGFTCPPGFYPCLYQWRCGWVANLCAWACLVLFLGSFEFIGIYVLMFTSVTKSLLKLMSLLIVFFMGFSIVFNLLQNEQTQFESIPNSLLSVFDMALGEINLSSNFLGATNVFAKDSLWAVSIFMFLINIVLVNLTIGVTIGDIEQMRSSARFEMMAQKVEWLYKYETNFPIWLRRRIHAKEYIKKRTSHRSNAKSSVILALKEVNSALAVRVSDDGPQKSTDNTMVELLNIKSQMWAIVAAVKELQRQQQSSPVAHIDGLATSSSTASVIPTTAIERS